MISRKTIPFPNLSKMAISIVIDKQIESGAYQSVNNEKIKITACTTEKIYCFKPDNPYSLLLNLVNANEQINSFSS